MKHNCRGAREREMSLMWVCSCGSQVNAEPFTEDELSTIEFALNKLFAGIPADEFEMSCQSEEVEKLLEKVRMM